MPWKILPMPPFCCSHPTPLGQFLWILSPPRIAEWGALWAAMGWGGGDETLVLCGQKLLPSMEILYMIQPSTLGLPFIFLHPTGNHCNDFFLLPILYLIQM